MGRFLIAAIAALTLTGSTLVYGQSYADLEEELQRPTLKGLPGVFLLLSSTDIISSADHSNIRTEVELILRTAGIRLNTRDDFRGDPTLPTLLISFSTTAQSRATVGWVIVIELSQPVFLARDPAIYSSAVTWKVLGSFGHGPRDSVLSTFRQEALDAARRFANAYLAVNPRK